MDEVEQDRRAARLAAALRANLRRRKAQLRGREKTPFDRARAVLAFWFAVPGDPEHGRMRRIWFAKDEAFDEEIRQRFLADYEAAAAGGYDGLATTPSGALALAILLDQFPRNLFRGTARAFATDAKARALAERAVEAGFDQRLVPVERLFLYLPFEHSENLADQHRSVALFESLPVTPNFPEATRDDVVDYARRHLAIIERFGRFPHRNAALGRTSTPEELVFLTEPGSAF